MHNRSFVYVHTLTLVINININTNALFSQPNRHPTQPPVNYPFYSPRLLRGVQFMSDKPTDKSATTSANELGK